MSNSEYIYNYLDSVWDLLPEKDRVRFAETWKSYERTYGDVWTRLLERQMAANIDYLPLYNVKRWLKHIFDNTTQLNLKAIYTSNQDLSLGINLQDRYLIKLSIDGGTPQEIDLRGLTPSNTKLFEIVDRVNLAFFPVKVASAVSGNQLLQFGSPTTGPSSTIEFLATSDPIHDASEIILGFDPQFDLPKTLPVFRYSYQLADATIAAIPQFQDRIHDELVTVILNQKIDYAVEFGTGIISFATPPPAYLWAKNTLFNKETPYNNYGYMLNIYDKNTESYLKAVKGLWFAFWTGPSPANIQRSLYLLFGLPTASQAGTVTGLSDTQVDLTYDDGTTESFAVPSDLFPTVSLNERVTRFQPLVSGIAVYDKINYPGFLEREVGRTGVRSFLTQHASRGSGPDTDQTRAMRLLEENTYLPQIDVASFVSPDIKLKNVQTFLSTLQPKSRMYLFQVLVGKFREKVNVKDEGPTGVTDIQFPNGIPALGLDIRFNVTPNVDWNNNTMADQDQLNEAEQNDYTYMRLDEGTALTDIVGVEVYQSATLIDSFTVEG